MKTDLFIALALTIFGWGLIYAFASFTHLSFNPVAWGELSRFVFSTLGLVWLAAVLHAIFSDE